MTQARYLDTLGIWEATAGLPEQLQQATATANDILGSVLLPAAEAVRSVAIFGMGTSGLAGAAAAAYAVGRAPVPIWVGQGYDAPTFVGPSTLAFVVSFSGDTEETCAVAADVLERGARVVIVARGGALATLATSSGSVLIPLPSGLPAERTALAALTVPLLTALARVGIVPDVAPTLAAAYATVSRRRDALMAQDGAADEVARLIGRTIPLVYGSTGLCAVAAERWKTQINENAKTPAFFAVQPELSHNEVAGWGQHGDVTRQVNSLVTLRHAGEHPHTARRFAAVVDATEEVMAHVIPVWAEGEDDLSRFFDLSLFGDFVSLHVAGREGIDPGPVPAVAAVEEALR